MRRGLPAGGRRAGAYVGTLVLVLAPARRRVGCCCTKRARALQTKVQGGCCACSDAYHFAMQLHSVSSACSENYDLSMQLHKCANL